MVTYFIDGNNGKDDEDGLTPDTAWKTTKPANRVRPGDTIYVRGILDCAGIPNGEPGKPITIDGLWPA